MRNAPKAPPPPPPRAPDGTCHHCGSAAAPFGRYCPACYGGVLHPEGRPLEPGDPDDPHRAFNAEADAYLADLLMPRRDSIGATIELRACRRRRRMIDQ